MALWNWWRKKSEKLSHGRDEKDITFPEDKGKVTLQAIKEKLRDIDDVIYKEWQLASGEKLYLVYMKSMIEQKVLNELVIDPLNRLDIVGLKSIYNQGERMQNDELPKVLYEIASGSTIILIPVDKAVLKVDTASPPDRAVETPESESTVLGPQDGFVESLDINLSLIKRRIRTPNLKTKTMLIGTEARQRVSVLYMDNIANKENVERVLYRIQNIEYQGMFGLSVMKQMMEDKPYSPFPQFGLTVRPDNAASALLDGRIIVVLDGSPDIAICPASLLEVFNSPEDFYNRWTMATLLRLIRFSGLFITILLTSTYVSVLTYHPEMLPPTMLNMLSESRTNVPFPPIIEVLLIEVTIEILREAGARMPSKIGQTIGIVGGIVIGTAAVEAGLASNILIVIVALSSLLSFLPSNFLMTNGIRFVRYAFIIMAGWLGMYGQMLMLAWLWIHLSNMTSLGTPYIAPGIPRNWTDLTNSVLRAPISYIMNRSAQSRAQKELTRPTREE